MNIGFINPRAILPFVIVIYAMTQSPYVGAEDDFLTEERIDDVAKQPANFAQIRVITLNDHIFAGNPDNHQKLIETEIDLKVNEICRKYDLNESQRSKLFLAACPEKRNYFRLIKVLQQKREAAQNDLNEVIKISRQASALRQNLLERDSFVSKVLQKMRNEEVSTIYEPNLNDRNYVRHFSNVNGAVRVVERHVVLSVPQREALVDLVLKETRAPRFFGDYDDLAVQYQLSRLPDEKWQPLFNEGQWPGVRLEFDNLRQCEPVLKRHGLINDEP